MDSQKEARSKNFNWERKNCTCM